MWRWRMANPESQGFHGEDLPCNTIQEKRKIIFQVCLHLHLPISLESKEKARWIILNCVQDNHIIGSEGSQLPHDGVWSLVIQVEYCEATSKSVQFANVPLECDSLQRTNLFLPWSYVLHRSLFFKLRWRKGRESVAWERAFSQTANRTRSDMHFGVLISSHVARKNVKMRQI